MLAELSEKQEAVRSLIYDRRSATDRTMVDGIIGSFEDEDSLIAVALALKELGNDPNEDVTENDLVWAMAFIDHLDTQNKKVVSK